MGTKKANNLKHRQVWLDENSELESIALNVLDSRKEEGFSYRQTITDALVRVEGTIPEYYEEGGSVQQRLQRIEQKIERNHEAMLGQFFDILQLIKDNPIARNVLMNDMSNDLANVGDEVKKNVLDVFKRAKERR